MLERWDSREGPFKQIGLVGGQLAYWSQQVNEYMHVSDFLRRLGQGDLQIADAACGYACGYYFLGHLGNYTGYDLSEEVIRENKRLRPEVSYHVRDLEKVPVQADIVVCLESAEHMKDPDRFLRSLQCRYLLFSAPVNLTRDFDPYHLHDRNKYQWREALRGAGFEVLYERDFPARCSFLEFCKITPTTWKQKLQIALFSLTNVRYFWDRFWNWIVGQRFCSTSRFYACRKAT